MSTKQQVIVCAVLLLTLLLFGAASQIPWLSMWGLNHLHFLGGVSLYIYFAVTALAIILILMPSRKSTPPADLNPIDRFLFGETRWGRLALAVLAMVLFYLFRTQTALIGDGMAWLDNFGRGEGYIHKWTEPGSIYLVRWLQTAQGAHTEDTALTAFRILSIISGGTFVYFAASVAGLIYRKSTIRLLTLTTLLLSGSILFFFGCPEFYGMSWATAMLFIFVSLKFVNDQARWFTVIAAYLLALLIHLQAVYFLLGLLYLFIRRIEKPALRKAGYAVLGLAALCGAAAIVWLYNTRIDFEILLLPILKSRGNAPGYTVFSLPHARDLLNLIFLVFPGAFGLLLMWLLSGKREWTKTVPSFLGILSVGSLAFLLLFGAAITMGRDWDIMSLSLLAPALLVLYHIDRSEFKLSGRMLTVYALTAAIMTIPFVSASVQTVPAEKRAYTLLNNNNRNAWLIYARYLRENGDRDGYQRIIDETHRRYPDYSTFRSLGQMEQEGKYREALEYSAAILRRNPYEPDYQRYYAGMCANFGKFSEAEKHYTNALLLQPYDAGLKQEVAHFLNGRGRYDEALPLLLEAHELLPDNPLYMESLALTHIYLEQYLKASAIAQRLLAQDKNSAGGHLVSMLVALGFQDREGAKYHYGEYVKYGVGRPGYDGVKESYKTLGE